MPSTWAEVLDRIGWVLADPAAADEWTRQALQAVYGAEYAGALPSSARAVALQKLIGTMFALEEIGSDGMLPFLNDGGREKVRAVFARYWEGHSLEGPPWRLSPYEKLPGPGEITSDFDWMEDL